MSTAPHIAPLLSAGCLAVFMAIGSASAQEKPALTDVLKSPSAVAEGQEITVMRVDYPPGFDSPKHYHTGQVILYVLEGTGAMEVDGEVRTATAGEVLQEQAEKAMVMSNESDTEWLRFVVFQIGPEGEPTFVKVE